MQLVPFFLWLTLVSPLPSGCPFKTNGCFKRPQRLLDYLTTLGIEHPCRLCFPWYSAFLHGGQYMRIRIFTTCSVVGTIMDCVTINFSMTGHSFFSLKRWSSHLHWPFLSLCFPYSTVILFLGSTGEDGGLSPTMVKGRSLCGTIQDNVLSQTGIIPLFQCN